MSCCWAASVIEREPTTDDRSSSLDEQTRTMMVPRILPQPKPADEGGVTSGLALAAAAVGDDCQSSHPYENDPGLKETIHDQRTPSRWVRSKLASPYAVAADRPHRQRRLRSPSTSIPHGHTRLDVDGRSDPDVPLRSSCWDSWPARPCLELTSPPIDLSPNRVNFFLPKDQACGPSPPSKRGRKEKKKNLLR